MTNKVVVITGTTSGTGFICAREVAKKGATVVLLNRESVRSKNALQQLQVAVPTATFDAVTCDLQNFESGGNAMTAIKAKYEAIDVLVNNAGVMGLRDESTIDGYDVQMQTNAISHLSFNRYIISI